MTRMYPNTRKALEEAGWYPGRCLDSTAFEEKLEERGYEISEPVLAFLREFGGLRIKEGYGMEEYEDDYTYICDFNKLSGLTACGNYEHLIKEPLFIIGSMENGESMVFITASGKLLGEYEIYLGDDAIDAFNNLVYGTNGKTSIKSYLYSLEGNPKGYVHEETYDLLREAGWYPGRSVDTSEFERAMQEADCEPNPAAIRFYQEFGGLKVLFKGKNHQACISPKYLQEIPAEYWKKCREYLGEPATIVGIDSYYDSWNEKEEIGYIIIVTESNQVHGVLCTLFRTFREKQARKFGDSLMEGWEKMLLWYDDKTWYNLRIEKEMEEYFANHPE